MWDWAVWGALIFAGVAGTGALALLVVRARQAWRDLRETRRDVVARLDRLAAAGETTADKLAAAGDTSDLQESLARLRISLARLAVLRAGIDEVQATFDRVTAILPRR
jgi:hypothetical protein